MARNIIRLAGKSRDNRRFFDALIRLLAVELARGGADIDPRLVLPSWRYFEVYGEVGPFAEIGMVLLPKTVAGLSAMLREEGPAGTLADVREILIRRTDLTDCHLTSLNVPPLTVFASPARMK